MSDKEFSLRLVGGQTIIKNDDYDSVLNFYGSLFSRLKTEVNHTGRVSRYLCFRSNLDTNSCFHGLFIEVAKDSKLPDGLIQWELDQNSLTVWSPGKDKNNIKESSSQVDWFWLKELSGDNKLVGEFSAPLPLTSGSSELFMLSGCSYIDLQKPVDDEVELVEYNPGWPKMYEEAEQWLRQTLPDYAISRIEHYGSTSIPGMPAKPVIDILVEIPSFNTAKQEILPLLVNQTCEYWWDSEHMIFIKRKCLNGKRTHHIHLAPVGHKLWKGLAFRDYLRTHNETAVEYAALKRSLASIYQHDRERYTKAKSAFINNINAKASEA